MIVAKAAGGFSRGAGELATGLAIALMRQIPAADSAVKRGRWLTPLTHVLHAKTLGILGLGHVGLHVAKIATAFGMRVLAWSPRLTEQAALAVGGGAGDANGTPPRFIVLCLLRGTPNRRA